MRFRIRKVRYGWGYPWLLTAVFCDDLGVQGFYRTHADAVRAINQHIRDKEAGA